MPDGTVATWRKAQHADNTISPVALHTGVEMEALWVAHRQAEDAMNSTTDSRCAELDRIQALYPKPPRRVYEHFLTTKSEHGLIERPAPYQEGVLLRNVEYWRAWGIDSDPCKHAIKLLTDWRAWDAECDAIYEKEGGRRLELDEEELERNLHETSDRFVEASTISHLGILLKLQYVAEIEDLADQVEENPTWVLGRIVLGLIEDLKREVGRE